jgi:hypothetical protein
MSNTADIPTIHYPNCEVCDSAEPDEVYTYQLRRGQEARRCFNCLTEGNGFSVDEWVYRETPEGIRTNNPYAEVF